MTLPCRGDLYDWYRLGGAGGLGYCIVGVMHDGGILQTGIVFASRELAGGVTEIETLNWSYFLHGAEHAAPAHN